MTQLKKIQNCQLNILKQMINFFDQAGLEYFAIGGTALGAIRHNGFIPWDDDIDIAMPRIDYEKLITLRNNLPSNLFLQHFVSEENYPLYFIKIRMQNTTFIEQRMEKYNINHGVFIDIFPFDNIEEQKTRKSTITKKIKKFKHVTPIRKFFGIKSIFYKLAYGFKSREELFNEATLELTKFNSKDTGLMGYPPCNDIIPTNELYPLRKEKFEDTLIKIPRETEKYLTRKYGDYMKLPNENQRQGHNPLKVEI